MGTFMLYMIQKNNHAIYAMLINRWNHNWIIMLYMLCL